MRQLTDSRYWNIAKLVPELSTLCLEIEANRKFVEVP
jgi:hypothetical protein